MSQFYVNDKMMLWDIPLWNGNNTFIQDKWFLNLKNHNDRQSSSNIKLVSLEKMKIYLFVPQKLQYAVVTGVNITANFNQWYHMDL